jgi:hypothetical protein
MSFKRMSFVLGLGFVVATVGCGDSSDGGGLL